MIGAVTTALSMTNRNSSRSRATSRTSSNSGDWSFNSNNNHSRLSCNSPFLTPQSAPESQRSSSSNSGTHRRSSDESDWDRSPACLNCGRKGRGTLRKIRVLVDGAQLPMGVEIAESEKVNKCLFESFQAGLPLV